MFSENYVKKKKARDDARQEIEERGFLPRA